MRNDGKFHEIFLLMLADSPDQRFARKLLKNRNCPKFNILPLSVKTQANQGLRGFILDVRLDLGSGPGSLI